MLSVRDALAQSDGARADLDRLASLVHEMDELFLLVVVGEYNSGKSTFINALLGDEVFAMGDLPTTRAISILRYGKASQPETIGEHVQLYHYPLEVLRDLDRRPAEHGARRLLTSRRRGLRVHIGAEEDVHMDM